MFFFAAKESIYAHPRQFVRRDWWTLTSLQILYAPKIEGKHYRAPVYECVLQWTIMILSYQTDRSGQTV